ncbi:MAG: DMT family transporter [Bacteroidaceae bacterium]|nr:DMT family transporter [Bacteroidaceae bacterium]
MQKQFVYHLVAFLVIAIWGSTFVVTKLLLLAGLSPAQIFTLRFIIAYTALLGIAAFRRPFRWFAKTWQDELLMLGLGLTGGSLYFLTENAAMNYTTTTNTALIVCLCPLFAALLISMFYKEERLQGIQIVGSLLAAAGVAIVELNGHFVLHLSLKGDALAFAACLCWAAYSLLMIPACKRYDTLFITRKLFFYGLLTMIPYYIIYPEWPQLHTLLQPGILLRLLFLGAIASTLCYYLWGWVIRNLGAVIATNYVYFNPVIAILCAWIVLSEQITMWFLLGTALILIGMYFADKKKRHTT